MQPEGELTVRQRYQRAIAKLRAIENSPERQDSESYQKTLWLVIKEFLTIELIVHSLSLFSSNEELREINSVYLQFISIPYYQATLLLKYMGSTEGTIGDAESRFSAKSQNLKSSLFKVSQFLLSLQGFGEILSKDQENRLLVLQNSGSPSLEEIVQSTGDAALRRALKISLFKEERALAQKLSILDGYYTEKQGDDDIFESMDEEVVRSIYVDQLKYHALKSFSLLESLAMEFQVLENRPVLDMSGDSSEQKKLEDGRVKSKLGAFDYTSRVEKDPLKQPGVAELINKLGRVLQPFVLTNKRDELRQKVFGTGQVLPSMSVEEYLDYELANGKMLKAEKPQNDSDESDDSDEELRQREWDDWKDDNPKGSGNMKANMG